MTTDDVSKNPPKNRKKERELWHTLNSPDTPNPPKHYTPKQRSKLHVSNKRQHIGATFERMEKRVLNAVSIVPPLTNPELKDIVSSLASLADPLGDAAFRTKHYASNLHRQQITPYERQQALITGIPCRTPKLPMVLPVHFRPKARGNADAERRERGTWFKRERKLALSIVRTTVRPPNPETTPDGVTIFHYSNDPEVLFKLKLAETLTEMFYDCALRLPDIRVYLPETKLIKLALTIASWSERALRHLAPEVILRRYEQIE